MDLVLIRNDYLPTGIFGLLLSKDARLMLYTLEHAYETGSKFFPKLPKGEYKCVRGMHQLAHMTEPFETFEITNVPGHTDILFHVGNYNKDSEGCVLLGLARENGTEIIGSRLAFDKFMNAQYNVDEFMLSVE